MNFKNLVGLVAVLFFVATLAGCSAIEGGVKGAFEDLNSLQKFAQSGGEKDVPFDQKWKEEQQLHEKIKEEKLSELKKLFLTPGVAVANAKDVAVTTGSYLAWEKLVNIYFLGQQKLALEWLERAPDPGFTLAIVQSRQFSADEKLRVVKGTCDANAYVEYAKENFPSTKTIKGIVKKCPDLLHVEVQGLNGLKVR